jgi:hypothetical protein
MTKRLSILVLAFAFALTQGNVSAQKNQAARPGNAEMNKGKATDSKEKKEAAAKSDDPVVGKTKDGSPVYEGARGGFYFIGGGGSKSYVKDFVGAKIVGKTADGIPIYQGPRGGTLLL